MEKNPLVGKVITAVYLADDQGAIRFDLEDGNSIVAKADGDCCSKTWIEHVENPEFLIGATVMATADVGGNVKTPKWEEPREDSGDVIQYYGFQIVTTKGHTLIDYRNSSNGYYGGSLSWPGDHYYGGVHGQNASKENWKKIA